MKGTGGDAQEEMEAILNRKKWLAIEDFVLALKSRISWLKQSDSGTRFCHASMKETFHRNFIDFLVTEDG